MSMKTAGKGQEDGSKSLSWFVAGKAAGATCI